MTDISGDQGRNSPKVFGDQGNLSLKHVREQVVLLMGNKGSWKRAPPWEALFFEFAH